jgi:phosphatidylinositol alpha-1,6-mannosyltransferase
LSGNKTEHQPKHLFFVDRNGMRRTLLITLEFPPQYGGVATVYEQLGHAAPEHKFVVLAPTHGDAAQYDEKQSMTIIREELLTTVGAGGWRGRIALRKLIKKLPEIITQYEIELVLVGNILPLGTAALLLRRQKNIPYAVYCHGMDVLVAQRHWRKRWLVRHILRQADRVLTNSKFTQDVAITAGATQQQVHIIQPLPTQRRQLVDSETRNHVCSSINAGGKRILLSVGRLVPRKGFDTVIAALPQIRAVTPDVMYVIVGNGPDLSRLQQLASEHGQTDAVRFVGSVAPNELAAYYELADVFLMVSRQIGPDVEGFGIVALDAGVYGKPVIGGKSGGVGEAVIDGETGILVDPQDPTATAQAVITLLHDSAYAQKLGTNGLARAEKLQAGHTQKDALENALS